MFPVCNFGATLQAQRFAKACSRWMLLVFRRRRRLGTPVPLPTFSLQLPGQPSRRVLVRCGQRHSSLTAPRDWGRGTGRLPAAPCGVLPSPSASGTRAGHKVRLEPVARRCAYHNPIEHLSQNLTEFTQSSKILRTYRCAVRTSSSPPCKAHTQIHRRVVRAVRQPDDYMPRTAVH